MYIKIAHTEILSGIIIPTYLLAIGFAIIYLGTSKIIAGKNIWNSNVFIINFLPPNLSLVTEYPIPNPTATEINAVGNDTIKELPTP